MFLNYFVLCVALSLSVIAAFYSIMGLAAIFSASVIPIIIMGSILEVAKLTVTVWLHEYWRPCKLLMKVYLSTAVILLMFITSMGIFGFLSKSHLDQAVPAGDVIAKVALFDEKINVERTNIAMARSAIKQMDAAVDQRLSRSNDDKGAERAIQIRRSQQTERARLLKEIDTAQKIIAKLNDERAPIASELRKVEADVGPIRYIAAFIYNEKPSEDILEKAVRWVIVTIIIVFDPLALMMLLASTEGFAWRKNIIPKYEPDDGPLTDEKIEGVKQQVGPIPTNSVVSSLLNTEKLCYNCGTELLEVSGIGIICPNEDCFVSDGTSEEKDDIELPIIEPLEEIKLKLAERSWKTIHPTESLKKQRILFKKGQIPQLPWNDLAVKLYPDDPMIPQNMCGFGTDFPKNRTKGDMFVRTDRLPTALFKFNGRDWIQVDKDQTDQYAYDTSYIEHLIQKISSGDYDPELLNNAEREQIAVKLRDKPTS